MATDKDKVMVFEGGPEDGREMEWRGTGGPPPQAHAVVDDSSIVVYDREDIIPLSDKIEYIYTKSHVQQG